MNQQLNSLSKWVENLCLYKTLYADISSNIIILFIIGKTWQQPRYLSINTWMNKLWYIQTVECYSALKRNDLSNHEEIKRYLKCISVCEKKLIWKGYIQCGSNYVTFWKRQNYGDSEKIGGCQKLGGWKGWISRAQSTFRAVKLLCRIL